MDLNKMAKAAYENSLNHGFWDGKNALDSIPEKLMLIVSELSEALEEYRNGNMDNYHSDLDCWRAKPEGFGPEMADAVIRIGDLAHALGYDLNALVKEKHEFNKTRPYKHGGKKC